MVFLSKLAGTLALATAFSGVLAHPGEKHDVNAVKREIMLRNLIGEHNRRALELCAGSEADVTLKARAIERRAATLKALREKRGIPSDAPLARRSQSDLNKYAALSHKSSAGYTLATDPSTIFAQNATCVLVPEVTIGPYWVAGELIREDITDGQAGVPLHLDIQFVDVNTCSGASDMLVDAWHCNALGVYSGVSATGQGGLDTTYCRGVQQSDDEGVVEFDTVFPGHYTGRAVHIHLKTTTDATIYDNNTYVDGVTHHIGQIFFDQSLISTVEASSPYTSNKQTLMQNTADSIAASESTSTHDPFVDYVLLGSSITDGVLGWITIGVDMKADHSSAVSAAAYYYASGGVSTGGSSGGGGGPPRK